MAVKQQSHHLFLVYNLSEPQSFYCKAKSSTSGQELAKEQYWI